MSEEERTPPVMRLHQRVGAWDVVLVWPGDSATGGPKEIHITPVPDADPQDVARGLSTTVLRQITVTRVEPDTRSAVMPSAPFQRPFPGMEDAAASAELRGYQVRAGLTDEYLAVLSRWYVFFVDRGVTAPVAHLSELGDRSAAAIKNHLKEARKRGLLTTVPGKAGGRLTERSREIIRRAREEE